MKHLALILCAFMVYLGTGCSAPKPKDDMRLEEAKRLYASVSNQHRSATEPILRCDWLPWYYHMLQSSYLYPVPHVSYFVYNGLLVYPKEGLGLPFSFITGGTEFQDDLDAGINERSIEYEALFNKVWKRQNNANYINMDRLDTQK